MVEQRRLALGRPGAGEVGDELFAGNERYATQRLFEYYQKTPARLRKPLVKPLVFRLADGLRLELLVKGKKYVQRTSILSPERGYFRKKALETLVERHETDETSFYGTVLWNLMVLESWQRRHWDEGVRKSVNRR